LITRKGVKLSQYADKERILDEKEFHNSELKKVLEAQIQKIKRSVASDNSSGTTEEMKNSVVSENQNEEKMKELQKISEEQRRLDKMRNQKFKIIMEAMAKVQIDEQNSEYNESVINSFIHDRRISHYNNEGSGVTSLTPIRLPHNNTSTSLCINSG
jgi:hypothetical protein